MAELVAPVDRYMIGNENIAPQVEEMITYDDLGWSPVGTFLNQVHGVEDVGDVVFRWSEKQAIKFSTTLTGAIAAVGAGVSQSVVFNSGNVVSGDVFYHTTSKQQFRVVQVTAQTATTTTANIVRISESKATVAVTGTPTLFYKSNQITSKGYYPIGKGETPTWYYNYVQVMTNVVGISKLDKLIKAYWGDQLQEMMMVTNRQHRSNFERDLWWGEAIDEASTWTNERGNVNTGHIYQSQGIDDKISTHSTGYGGTLTEETFNDLVSTDVYGSRNSGGTFKLLPAGPGFIRAVNQFAVNRLQTYVGAEEYGVDIKQYHTWGGRTLAILEEREFMDNPDYDHTAYALEPEMIEVKTLGPYMTSAIPIGEPNRFAQEFAFETIAGFQIKQEKKHAKFYKLAA